MKKACVVLGLSLCLVACSSTPTYAPVTEISPIEPLPKNGTHTVMQGETLYEIAWRYGLDYRYLAKRNDIAAPYSIQPGEQLTLRGQAAKKMTQPRSPVLATSGVTPPVRTLSKAQQWANREPNFSSSKWTWPVEGKIINPFSSSNKGVNIAGVLGQPIRAAASGKVVYAGSGLRGYGNLILLKHNSLYLSAYAHNRILLVKEGDWVKQGQKIAEMGNTGANKVMLHFEIRRAGKPVNPVSLYP